MLPLGGCGCNGKTGRAAWGARMNKNIAWILAILFGGAALGTWYLDRDALVTDQTNPVVDQAQTGQSQVDPSQSEPQGASEPEDAAKAASTEPVAISATPSESDTDVSDQNENIENALTDELRVIAPVLETARIDADGAVVIAGRAAAGAQVEILVDDAVQHTVFADSAGNFVALFDLPKSTIARSLTLRVVDGDTVEYAEQDIIIAPSQIKAAQATEENTQTPEVSQKDDADTDLAAAQTARQAAKTDVAKSEELANVEAEQAEQSTNVELTEDVTAQPRLSTSENTEPQTNETAPAITTKVQQVVTATETAEAVDQGSTEIATSEVSEETSTSVDPSKSATAAATDQTLQVSDADISVTDAPKIEDGTSEFVSSEIYRSEPEEADANVSEPSQPTVFAADAAGVKVLQGADALPAGQIIMDAISYDAAGGVMMSGRGQAAAQLQFYLNNQLIETTQIDAQGFWSQDMSGVAPGVYTLRLDQLDAAGRVTARFETPFKREDRATLAAAAAQVAQQAAQAASEQTVQKTTDQSETQDTLSADQSSVADATAEATSQTIVPVQAITVQPGNTLWGISRARYGQGILYVRVFDANRDKIRDPDLIYPGQVFVLPLQE